MISEFIGFFNKVWMAHPDCERATNDAAARSRNGVE
jgi:hypothetical protein